MSERLLELAGNLGLSDKALAKLVKEHGDDTESVLSKWWDEARDVDRFLGRQGDYTTSPFAALSTSSPDDPRRHTEPAPVSEEYQKVITLASHSRWASYMEDNRANEVAEQQGKQLVRKLRRLQVDAAKVGVDLTPRLVSMVEAAEAEIAEKRKAA